MVSGKYILETLILGIKIGIGFPKSASGARRGSRANVSIISRGFWVCTYTGKIYDVRTSNFSKAD